MWPIWWKQGLETRIKFFCLRKTTWQTIPISEENMMKFREDDII